MFPLQSLQPHSLLWTIELLLRLLSQYQVVLRVSESGELGLSTLYKCLQPILADRLQQHQAGLVPLLLSLLQQALVDEGSHTIQHDSRSVVITRHCADGLDRLQGATTYED